MATSGFTSDVKVWEVKFSRTGELEKVHRAFELPGTVRHSCCSHNIYSRVADRNLSLHQMLYSVPVSIFEPFLSRRFCEVSSEILAKGMSTGTYCICDLKTLLPRKLFQLSLGKTANFVRVT